MTIAFSDNHFQLWEFRVSHGSLLIRSPKSTMQAKNKDLIFTGVEYLAVSRHLRGIEIVEATTQEHIDVQEKIGKKVTLGSVRILLSQGRRFVVVATGFSVNENENDIFDSPLSPRA